MINAACMALITSGANDYKVLKREVFTLSDKLGIDRKDVEEQWEFQETVYKQVHGSTLRKNMLSSTAQAYGFSEGLRRRASILNNNLTAYVIRSFYEGQRFRRVHK